MSRNVIAVIALLLAGAAIADADTAPSANLDASYQALRNLKPGNEALLLENVVLKRDAATFTLTGRICFVPLVQGKVTGAVFAGNGTFTMEPPLVVEKRNLSRLTRQPGIFEEFEQLVLRFTDGTYDELKKAASTRVMEGGCNPDAFNDIANALRKDLRWNLTARILQDVYAARPGGLFVAFVKGKKYNGKEVFIVDPHGAPRVAPEEVELETWSDTNWGIWAAFHLQQEYAQGKATSAQPNAVIKIEKQEIDLTVEKSGKLTGKTTTTLVSQEDGVRVVPFDLYPTLRVEAVTDSGGQTLNFIQEDKDQDAEFWVVLPKPLALGEQFSVKTTYSGKDALQNTGSGNYYLVSGARHAWYPGRGFEDYATYNMRFAFPKDLKLVASGTPIKEVTGGSQTVSEWTSEGPQTVAAFQLGRFKKQGKALKNLSVETYANEEVPDSIREIQQSVESARAKGYVPTVTLGSISTTGMAKKAMAEAEIASDLYSDYFGPVPFKRLALTQQTADNYGQSWPQLVWLPLSYFLDDTIRHQIYGFDPRGYFKVVGPHEIAHQWWGHTVTWASYRDQWMSEGFSELSASIFLQVINKTPHEYIKFWNDEHNLIVEKDKEGFRPIDVGPVTLGYRLNNSRVGSVTRNLIYPKGGYILHMIRMMMWNPKTGDEIFKQTMRDFVATYRNRPATTEDFKAIVEKHMTPQMNLGGDGKMDWFFNEYVYGTALPSYRFTYSLNGTVASLEIAQSGVDKNFRIAVPVYVELANGHVVRLGSAAVAGNDSFVNKVDLASFGLKEAPKRLLINYFNDVLCDKIDQR
jgi:hypothetical protein